MRCRDCSRVLNERTGTLFTRLQYPTDVICLVVLWRFRYKLSLWDLAEMFLQQGIMFTHEAVREWESKLPPLLSETLRKPRHGAVGRSWYVGEAYIKVQGQWWYLYRAIDRDGNLVSVRLSDTRDLAAAEAFFRSAWTVIGVTPDRITTDGHDAYPRAIRDVFGEGVAPPDEPLLKQPCRTGPAEHQATLPAHVWPPNLRHRCALLPRC
jgi:putative transposase